jgi:hypothetical protein
MPRLQKYRNRNACYVLTAIRGTVITFQLTLEGEMKLTAAGIACGQKFHRALLLDLYRTGDAYTGGSGVDDPALVAAGQLEMDFANDPDPETAFPACDVCRSVNDLHLTLTGPAEDLVAQLPALPSKKGARGSIVHPDGSRWPFTVTDEIVIEQSDLPEKRICLQRINFGGAKEELRLGYYIIGKKPRMLGKWVWGQFAPLIPMADFEKLVHQAISRGWVSPIKKR